MCSSWEIIFVPERKISKWIEVGSYIFHFLYITLSILKHNLITSANISRLYFAISFLADAKFSTDPCHNFFSQWMSVFSNHFVIYATDLILGQRSWILSGFWGKLVSECLCVYIALCAVTHFTTHGSPDIITSKLLLC